MDDNRRLPLVYVRGFAGGTRGIDKAVDDPFYGFNEGSTHVRVGAHNQPLFHQFESPLLRLLREEGYELLVHGNQAAYLAEHDDIPAHTVWIHRFYDRSATTWGGSPQEYRLENAAADLLDLIDRIRDKTGAPAVYLVAHSMGGLICRCLLQKVLPDRGRTADCVAKLFTYGTPHGGITFELGGGLLERVRDMTGVQGADIFGPRRMYAYLTPQARTDPDGPPEGWDAREMPQEPGALPVERVFCLVGTDPTDYDVALGLSAAAVGPHSDGLVQIERAYVPGAHRAYVHRSHSGRYGIVNSEEGYQNLRRFLFGDTRVQASLVDYRLSGDDDVVWQAEARLSVRGLPVVLHERLAAHWCPFQLDARRAGQDASVPLATTFLNSDLRTETDEPMRFILQLRLISLREKDGVFGLFDHLEQTADFADTLVIDVGPRDADPGVRGIRAAWNSDIVGAIRDHRVVGAPRADEDPTSDRWVAHIELPATAAPLVGADARIRLVATPWG
ncbi:alpha/beta fold hydrolase [Streptomyces ferrugineus]|uniref:Alpha/beta fold hydrolase n=1 Tax=Streptomyces ferrugineus TaxID=1413221 RepID=A0A7M2SQU2_9ACTN|nr:alpha/beta fold hydrolase [Streptomyces ferrugineus]QOV38737.1 alpha/beta fold hydrolase [Streptomyces ferrugineus]